MSPTRWSGPTPSQGATAAAWWFAGCSIRSPSKPARDRAAITHPSGRPTAGGSPLSASAAPPTRSSPSTLRWASRSRSARCQKAREIRAGRAMAATSHSWARSCRSPRAWSTTRGRPSRAMRFAAPPWPASLGTSATSTTDRDIRTAAISTFSWSVRAEAIRVSSRTAHGTCRASTGHRMERALR